MEDEEEREIELRGSQSISEKAIDRPLEEERLQLPWKTETGRETPGLEVKTKARQSLRSTNTIVAKIDTVAMHGRVLGECC